MTRDANLPPGVTLRDLDAESDDEREERRAQDEDDAHEKVERLNDGLQ